MFSGSTGTDPALTELGTNKRALPERLRVMLENIRPQAIIASPLQRTQQTAEYAAQALDLPILTDPLYGNATLVTGRVHHAKYGKYPELSQEWMRDPTVVPPMVKVLRKLMIGYASSGERNQTMGAANHCGGFARYPH